MNLRRFHDAAEGVSPVVGSILILVIMIISIGGIIAWGVPAIQGLQDRAEYQAVLTQYLQMDADVRNLRDPQNTRISTISISQGQILYGPGDRWVVTASRDAAYDDLYLDESATPSWKDSGPGPASVTFAGVAIPGTAQITVDEVQSSTFTTRYSCASGCSSTVSLGTIDLDASVVRIQIRESGTVKAETWIFNVGMVSYRLSDTSEQNQLHFEMGAVFTHHDDFFYLEDAPTVKDPDYDALPQDTSMFVRILQLTGPTDQGVGGKGRFPVVYHLVDNYGASRGRPSFDPATSVRFQIDGLLEVPFCNYFDERDGWVQEGNAGECPDSGSDGDVNLRYDRGANPMIYDLSHSVVTTSVRTL